jgi:hypothetical protein
MFKKLSKGKQIPLKKTVLPNRSYSTVKLSSDVKKYLKPEVIKYLESKEDSLLIQKVNYIAPEISVRLNVAPQLLLEQVDSENVYDILANQIVDVWEHYWYEVKKNGTDHAKWMASIKECIDLKLPYQTNICWLKGVTTPGTYFKLEEYKVMFKYYATMGFYAEFALLFDDLYRIHQDSKPDQEVDALWVELLFTRKDYPHAKVVMEHFEEKKKMKFDEGMKKKIEDFFATADERAHAEYIDSLESKDYLSGWQKERIVFYDYVQDMVDKSLELSIRPPH